MSTTKRIQKWTALLTALLIGASLMGGCQGNAGGKDNPTVSQSGTDGTAEASKANETNDVNSLPWMDNSNLDTSDLPTWTGKQLTLTYWQGEGTGGQAKKNSAKDVVTPEVKRVTGITIDEDNSFDNGGQSWDVKLSMLAAANEWPSLVYDGQDIKKLKEAGKLYELTDLIPKYCPTLMKMKEKLFVPDPKLDNKDYYLPFGLYEDLYINTDWDTSVDKSKYSVFAPPPDTLGYIWVRDDILKKIYPNAKTRKEIEDLYVQKGAFTQQDILDVPLNSYDDFIKFLYDVQALHTMEGNKPVSTTFVANGTDNWALMTNLMSWLEGRYDTDYYTYFDRKEQKMSYEFKQPDFRASLLRMNKLVRDGITSSESLLDSNEVFKQKLDNGLYAVSYAWWKPDLEALKAQNKPYSYRKVYLNVPQKADQYLRYKGLQGTRCNIAIFKDSVAEEDLPQILRWYEYMLSDAGQKLICWGPMSAGLFDEVNGKRVFKDKDLEEAMVYQKQNGKALEYNLADGADRTNAEFLPSGGLMVTFMNKGRSKYHPAVTYDRVPNPAVADQAFSMGNIQQADRRLIFAWPQVWSLGEVPGLQKAFAAKKAFEDGLTKTLTANSDDQFAKLFDDFLKTAEKIGFTDENIAEADKYFKEHNNVNGVNYMDNLK